MQQTPSTTKRTAWSLLAPDLYQMSEIWRRSNGVL
jgi:hypothetical protein